MASVLDIEAIRTQQALVLRAVTSDDEAVASFTTIFPRMAETVQPPRRTRIRQSHPVPKIHPDVHALVVRLIADLAVSVWAETLRNALEQHDPAAVEVLFRTYDAQDEWLHRALPETNLAPVWAGTRVLREFESLPTLQMPTSPCYEAFLDTVATLYPELSPAAANWLLLVEQDGIRGLLAKLDEAWKAVDRSRCHRARSRESTVQPKRYIETFVRARLAPVLAAHLMVHALRVQARAEVDARRTWNALLRWVDEQREAQALARLCGTWKWTLHNHQYHRDHTMTLSFLPADQYQSGQLRPAVIEMHGDTVYLRWEFPSGVQEDSLLFSNRDRRLEGTFIDSRGPYGTISGMRIRTCAH
ncbi:MAG: hypothetical protein D6690_08080 [Nitrospirae bacterium]|nr:MAG: hypothetical protein D6690_08080 [Nitrospirota bacterium]